MGDHQERDIWLLHISMLISWLHSNVNHQAHPKNIQLLSSLYIFLPHLLFAATLFAYNISKLTSHSQGSGVSTFALPITNTSKAQQVFTYTLPHPGPNPVRQDVPHVHQTILDPTSKFIIAPDLGADKLHIFSINPSNGILTPCPSYNATPGIGPRHAAFTVREGKTFMYLASELGNNVTSFEVIYPKPRSANGCLALQPIQTAYPYLSTPPAGSAVGEIRVIVRS
jgi:hypothetical protein